MGSLAALAVVFFACGAMVATKQQALEIAAKARRGLEQLYGERLRGVYLYGSAARDQLTPDSDIDIAVILDEIPTSVDEHQRTSQLGADLSLDHDTVVLFFFATEADFQRGRFAIHRAVKEEGIAA
jgi:predicted nucleotidyltransferase